MPIVIAVKPKKALIRKHVAGGKYRVSSGFSSLQHTLNL
jgi:hypothetical protein